MVGLHLKITSIAGGPAHPGFNAANGTLALPEAGTFYVIIKEYDDELQKLNARLDKINKQKKELSDKRNKEAGDIRKQTQKWSQLSLTEQEILKKKNDDYKKDTTGYDQAQGRLDDKIDVLKGAFDKLNKQYAGVRWIYRIIEGEPHYGKESYNAWLEKGSVEHLLEIPPVVEGGQIYIEAYFYDPVKNENGILEQQYPQNKAPYGCLIKVNGTPEAIAVEWKDKNGNDLKEKVAFGSTVYLHVYTAGLYGKDINILLRDTEGTAEADLTLTPAGQDGEQIESLGRNGSDKYFLRKVDGFSYPKEHPCYEAPKGTISSILGKVSAKPTKEVDVNIQKAVFAVFIDPKWQFEGSGYGKAWFDDGEDLTIHPVVYHGGLKNGSKDFKDATLKVSKDDYTYNETELHGNSPALISAGDMSPSNDGKKRVHFTFGVFIDGTLNSMYNTIARQHWENEQIKKRNKKGDVGNPDNHLKVAADSQKDLNKTGEKRYHYKNESSYENDLSNPAIIFQHYTNDENNTEHKRFRIYSEGMGTDTLAGEGEDEQLDENGYLLKIESYDTDNLAGTGLGQGKSGIIARVKRAIELMVAKINLDEDETIGIITVDVFGFSRGAASARHFVHEIMLGEYPASTSIRWVPQPFGAPPVPVSYTCDHNNYEVSENYKGKMLPPHGRLGYLLREKDLTFDNLIVRFVGIYDTVPHHSLNQDNDIKDLGLNTIGSKAKYTVHLVAADEHRKNFSLVDIRCITGKEGGGINSKGAELYLPGVHCDVGGSYAEGRKEKNGRIQVNQLMDQNDLQAERSRLLKQGWYKEHELTIEWDNVRRIRAYGAIKVLVGTRQHVSNQYSFIPLHIMGEFANRKGLPVNNAKMKDAFDFKDTAFSSKSFLEGIRKRLWDYAFNNGSRYDYTEVAHGPIVARADDHTAWERVEAQRAIEEDKLNAEIKKLRHDYLHWNANYGEGGSMMDSVINTLLQPNEPNFEGDIRKRTVRG